MNKKQLIKKLDFIINQHGEEFSDGEIIDQICDVLEEEKGKES